MINRRLPHVDTDPSYTSPQVTTRMAAAVLAWSRVLVSIQVPRGYESQVAAVPRAQWVAKR
jgi:hypothetical protein